MEEKKDIIEQCKELGNTILCEISVYTTLMEMTNLTNEQFFLDFLDEINKLSIKY